MRFSGLRRLPTLLAVLAVATLGASARAAAPASPSYSGIWISSLTASWTRNGSPVTDLYTAIISTGPSPSTNGFAANQSSTTANLSATFFNLGLNTTYYVDVQDATSGSAFTHFTATSTLAAPPASGAPPTAGSSQILATWQDGSNPSGTLFDCQISTMSDFSTLFAENVVADVQTIFPGLTPNTLHYLRVQALNNNSVPTGFIPLSATYTSVSSPGSGFGSVGNTLATVIWNSNGNPSGTFYKAVLSTAPSPGTNANSGNISSTTANVYATFTGMTPNTLYYGAVQALGSGGNSPFSDLGSTITLANAPISDTSLAVSGTEIVTSWTPNGNPSGTTYGVQVSTSSNFSPVLASQTGVGNSATVTGLTSVSTYYFRVQAINGAGTPTAYVTLSSATTLRSTPGVSAFTGLTVSQIQANWTANGNSPQKTYTAVLSTGASPGTNGFAGNVSSTTANLFAVFSGLALNATYYVDVQAMEMGGGGAFTSLGSTWTLAAAPAASGLAGISSHSITASWTSGNPTGTLYLLQASTNASFDTITSSVTTASLAATVDGLTALTTYYLEVEAINLAGTPSAFTSLGSTTTRPNLPPAAPTLSSAAVGTSSITWTWTGIALADGYRLVTSTGGNLYGDFAISVTSWTETGLSTNTSYARALVAFNGVGLSTSAQVSLATLATAPTASSVTAMGISSVTFSWTAAANPSTTTYIAELWQASGATTTVTTSATSVVFSLIPGTTYFLDVYARNLDGVRTQAVASTSTLLPFVTLDNETIFPDTGGMLAGYTSDGPVTVVFPPGTFPVTVTATLTSPVALPHALSRAAQLTATGVGLQIDVVPPLQPSKPVAITAGYLGSEIAGFSASQLTIAYYDPAENLWVPVPSSSNGPLNQVTGQSRHLSVFQIMAATPAADLSAPKVFPNPFRPSLGHSLITFSQLPANTRLRVYTVLGELVKDLSTDDTGIARWDATNQSGQNVASGAYFALAQAVGNKTILKVMIQR